jgi:hypothetical protein
MTRTNVVAFSVVFGVPTHRQISLLRSATDERTRQEPKLAQGADHIDLVSRQLHVDVKPHLSVLSASEVLERVLKEDRREQSHLTVVLRYRQPSRHQRAR